MNGDANSKEQIELVKRLYVTEGKTLMEIVSILGISYRTVQKIKSRNNFLKPFHNKEMLERLINEKKTNIEIAEVLGVSTSTVTSLKKKYGFETNNMECEKILTKEYLNEKYNKEGLNATQIAKIAGCSPTSVNYYLKKHHFKIRPKKGRYAELLVLNELRKRGFFAEDMNEDDPCCIYDIKVNNKIRIEVKSTKINKKTNCGQISLLNPKKLTLTDYRIKMKNGYTRKIFRKTCDFVIMVVGSKDYYIVPSHLIPDHLMSASFGPVHNDYELYKDRWDLIKETDAATSET